MQELDEIDGTLARLRYELCGLKLELKFRRLINRKAGFDPGQPRDALGMWTDGSGGASVDETGENQVSATFADLASVPRFEELLGGNGSNTTEDFLQNIAATITQDTARTGIPTIDETTEKLSADLIRVMDGLEFIPDQTPQAYGIAGMSRLPQGSGPPTIPGLAGTELNKASFSRRSSNMALPAVYEPT
jgi:hypothetical protein